MSFHDAFTSPRTDATALHPPAVPQQLRESALRIRRTFGAVNIVTVLALAGLNLIFPDALATPVVGRITLGIALIGLYGAVLIASAIWYDRAFATRCDQMSTGLTSVEERR